MHKLTPQTLREPPFHVISDGFGRAEVVCIADGLVDILIGASQIEGTMPIEAFVETYGIEDESDTAHLGGGR